MRFLLILSLCVSLLGCDSSEDNIINTAKSAIAEQLMNPDAAKFSDVVVHKGESGVAKTASSPDQQVKYQRFTVCGSVNGKNAFNAYTGKKRFVVNLVKVDSENQVSVIHSVYEDDGLQISAISSKKTQNTESLFEHIYWNKDCADEQHPKSYTGKN